MRYVFAASLALLASAASSSAPPAFTTQPLSWVIDYQPAPAAPYLNLPKTKTAKPNRYFCLKPDTNCKSIKWIIPAGLDKLDPEIPIKDANVLVIVGDTGTYTVQAYGALGDQATDIASCVITIGEPPAPPTPPAPPSALTAALQAGYTLDTDADRAKSLAFLQAAYQGMASQATTWTTVKTNADALAVMKAVVQAPSVGLTAAQLVNLRKAIAAELVKVFGATPTTPIGLAALATELGNIATALMGVK